MKPIRDPEPIALFGARLRALRKQSGLTQQAVADRLQIDRTTYTKYEIGRVSPDQQGLLRLAQLFNVTLDTLLGNGEAAQSSALVSDGQMTTVLTSDETMLLQMFRQLPADERAALTEQIHKRFREQNQP